MAIAFVSTSDIGNNNNTAASYTVGFTVSSNLNRVLILNVMCGFHADPRVNPTASYNGVAMTFAVKEINPQDPDGSGGSGKHIFQYFLNNPTSGLHNIVINATPISGQTTCYISGTAAEYSGCAQSATPDSTAAAGNNNSTTPSIAVTLATVADNAWGMSFEAGSGTRSPTGVTLRSIDAAFGEYSSYDTNGPITPTGGYTITMSRSSFEATGTAMSVAQFTTVVPIWLVTV